MAQSRKRRFVDGSTTQGGDGELVCHVCLNVKLLAMDGSNNLTFFRVPLMNSLYISDRRYLL